MMEYWTLAFLTLTGLAYGQEIIIPPADITAVVGSTISFFCRVGFGPIETMSWEFNEAIVYSLQDGYEHYPCTSCGNKYTVTRNAGNFTLRVNALDLNDGGKYTCIAMIPSATAALIVLDTPKISNSTLSSAEGSIVEYTCKAQFARPPKNEILPEKNPVIGMFLAGDTMTGVVREEKCDGLTNCYYYTQTKNLTLEASMNRKQLICDISTPQPQVHVNSSTMITVLYSVRNVSYTPENGQYEVGTKITCLADGNPKPQYVWDNMYTGKSINGELLNVTEEMFGDNTWGCTAKNSIEGTLHEETTVAYFTVVKPGDNEKAGNASVGIGVGVTFAVCVFGVILTLLYCGIKHQKPTCMTAKKSKSEHKEGETKPFGTVHENERLLSDNEKGDNVEGILSKYGHSECSNPGHDDQIVVTLEDDKSDKNSFNNKVEGNVGTTPMTTLASTAAATISQSHFNTKATQSMPRDSNVSQNIKKKSKKSDGTDMESQATVEGTDQLLDNLLEESVSLSDDKSKPSVGDNVKGNKGKKYPAPGVPSLDSLHENNDGSVSQLEGAHTSTSPKDTTEENNEPDERNKITHSTETENCQKIVLSDSEESVPLSSESKLDVGDNVKDKTGKKHPAPEVPCVDSSHKDNDDSVSQLEEAHTSTSSKDITEENSEPDKRNKTIYSTEEGTNQSLEKSPLSNEKSKVNAWDKIENKSEEDPAPEVPSKHSLRTDSNGSLSQAEGAPTSASSRDTMEKTQVEATVQPHDKSEMLSNNQKDDNNGGDVTEISNLKSSLIYPDSIHSSSERIEAQTSGNLSSSLPGDEGVSSTRAAGQQDGKVNTDDVVEHNTVQEYALGHGNFGDILNTRHLDKDVTIFRFKGLLSEDLQKAFTHGSRLLMKYKHTSIAKFIGTISTEQSAMITMEYESGGVLQQFLQEHGKDTDNSQLIKMCEDVLDGMIYLERQPCIHRALAACNCLVGENNAVKIFNFSWAREGKEFQGDQHEPLPIMSASPEALKEGKYSFFSDVWSFGVLIWEIFSHGETPYGKDGETREDLIRWIENKKHLKLNAPDGTPKQVEKILHDCWKDSPKRRPNSKHLKARIRDAHKSEIALNLV